MYIFILEEKESEKENRLILSIYEGDIKEGKTGYITGKYKKNLIDNENIKNLVKEIDGIQIDKNKITINYKFIGKILKNKNRVLCYKKNHKLYKLKNLINLDIENLSVENNKFYIIYLNKVEKVNEKYKIYCFNNLTLIIFKENIYLIEKEINKQLYKQTIISKNAKKVINKTELFNMNFINKKENYNICESTKIVVELFFKEKKILMKPFITYDGEKGYEVSKRLIKTKDNIFYKDFNKENIINKFFNKYNKIDNYFVIDRYKAYNETHRMIKKGFLVFINNKKLIEPENMFKNIRIKSNINWFEVKGNIEFNNESINISEYLGNRTCDYIEDSNYSAIIPNNIKKILRVADKDGNIKKTSENFNFIIENFKESFNKEDLKNLFTDYEIELNIPYSLKQNLYNYQIEGILWMKKLILRGFGACLADDMGLGKTIQILSLLTDKDINDKFNSILIVVPKIILNNWQKEYYFVKNEYYDLNIYYGKDRSLNSDFGITLTTYDIINNDFNMINEKNWDLIIIDEAQRVKNKDSKIRKKIKELTLKSITLALTGTPYENNLLELWSIMDIINPGMLGSSKDFILRYLNQYDMDEKYKEIGYKISPFIKMRKKEDVLKELPKKIVKNIYCVMKEKQQNLYNSMLIRIKKDLQLGLSTEINRFKAINGLMYLREICCDSRLIKDPIFSNNKSSIKVDVILNLINKTIKSNDKIVVFSQFTRFLSILRNELDSKSINYCYIDGKTLNRDIEIEKFENSNISVMFISLKAGGMGINLTSANKMIISDPWWNPAVERQAEDRIYRIGQKKDVTIYRLITKGTVEEKIQDLKSKKDDIGTAVFDSTVDFNKLDSKKILELYN